MKLYSIIIPIHNEINFIPKLLKSLESFSKNKHEIIIIDDGSNDGSTNILKNCDFIKLIIQVKNKGKGAAIKKGLEEATHNKIITFDGDMELRPLEMSRLMILDRTKNIYCALGYRFNNLNLIKSSFYWGNFIFTTFFNLTYQSCYKDSLCCAKAFYKKDLKYAKIYSNGFDIDVELLSLLSIKNKRNHIQQIFLNYKRRSILEGKKLKISDGWKILVRIIKTTKYF